MSASNTKFDGNIHDLINIERIQVLGLTATTKTARDKGKKYTIHEWRDSEGNLYFYSVRDIKEEFKTSDEARAYQKKWRDNS